MPCSASCIGSTTGRVGTLRVRRRLRHLTLCHGLLSATCRFVPDFDFTKLGTHLNIFVLAMKLVAAQPLAALKRLEAAEWTNQPSAKDYLNPRRFGCRSDEESLGRKSAEESCKLWLHQSLLLFLFHGGIKLTRHGGVVGATCNTKKQEGNDGEQQQ